MLGLRTGGFLLPNSGKILPNVDPTRFNLKTVADAHAAVELKSATGKVVIDVAE